MTQFLIALLCFLASHVVPARTGLRAWAIARIGRAPYMAGYSVLSLGLVVWVVYAAQRAPHVEIWPQADWQFLIPLTLMPVALALLAAGLSQPNPLSISIIRADDNAPLADIVRISRHPVLWGFGLWAVAHLPANGDLVSIILFGGFGLFAFAGMALVDRRRQQALGPDSWQRLASGTSTVPFVAILQGRAGFQIGRATLGAFALGAVAYLVLLMGGHRLAFGVDPLAPF